jgi:hypothetical protein
MFSSKQVQEMYKSRKLLDKCKTYGKIPPDDSYVYIVQQGLRVVYVGKGTGWRFLHPNSGRSSNIQLNAAFFRGVVFDVYLLKMGMTDAMALELEIDAIDEFKPMYNCCMKPSEWIGKLAEEDQEIEDWAVERARNDAELCK